MQSLPPRVNKSHHALLFGQTHLLRSVPLATVSRAPGNVGMVSLDTKDYRESSAFSITIDNLPSESNGGTTSGRPVFNTFHGRSRLTRTSALQLMEGHQLLSWDTSTRATSIYEELGLIHVFTPSPPP